MGSKRYQGSTCASGHTGTAYNAVANLCSDDEEVGEVVSDVVGQNGEEGSSQVTSGSGWSGRRAVRWSGNINNGGTLRHMEKIPGVNEYMGHSGALCTFFCLHVENDRLEIVPYLHSRATKVWYIFLPCQAGPLENFLSTEKCNPAFLNMFPGSVHQLNGAKVNHFNPGIISGHGGDIPVYEAVQTAESFII